MSLFLAQFWAKTYSSYPNEMELIDKKPSKDSGVNINMNDVNTLLLKTFITNINILSEDYFGNIFINIAFSKLFEFLINY